MTTRERHRRPPIPIARAWCAQAGCGLEAEIRITWFTDSAEGQLIEDDTDQDCAEVSVDDDRAAEWLGKKARWRQPTPSSVDLCRDDARAAYSMLKTRAIRQRTAPPWHTELAPPETGDDHQ